MKLDSLSRKKKLLLLGGCLALVPLLLVIAAVAPQLSQKDPDGQESLSQPIPEADIEESPEGKTDSYNRSGIADYWDSLEELEEEDTHRTQEDRQAGRHDGRRPEAVTVEDMFGDVKDEELPRQKEPQHSSSGRTSSGGGGTRTASSTAKSGSAAPKASDVPHTEPSATPDASDSHTQVKRSGAISSLDEDVSEDLGNGFSTLDGADMWVSGETGKPYRCMFTRDEKVRTGQRISLRLLEDLVIGGTHIPKNTHLQGVCSISDRMEVRITSLDMGGRILSFHFEAYDTDGGKGIYCSDLSKTKKEVTDQGLSTVMTGLNSRLGSAARDAANVGASIIRTKTGEVSVSVPAGYTFYIVEEKR